MLPLLLVLACAPEPVLDLTSDVERTGVDGADGPYGVAHVQHRAPARVSEAVDYSVSFPASDAGELDRAGAPYPVFVFVHGGLVEPSRYRWLATHLASRGYVVVSPQTPLDLAIFESYNASIALDDARWRSGREGTLLSGGLSEAPAYIGGHSLGGVVGVFRWVADPDNFEGVAILASWPAGGTPVEAQAGRPSISLIGSQDRSGEATQTAYDIYTERFPEPRWFGVVQGMNHYDWADTPSDANLRGDGPSERPRDQTRRDAAAVLDSWLDANMLGDAEAQQRLVDRDFDGVGQAP